VLGIALADAYGIQRCVHQVVAGDKSYKQVGKLAPLFFPLTTILCSAVPGRPLATPQESLRSAEAMIGATRERWPDILNDEQTELFEAAVKRTEPDTPQGRERQERLLLKEAEAYLFEPPAADVRADVLAAVDRGVSTVRTRRIRRPRVILIGPGGSGDGPVKRKGQAQTSEA
jgi:hypothetical protein